MTLIMTSNDLASWIYNIPREIVQDGWVGLSTALNNEHTFTLWDLGFSVYDFAMHVLVSILS